MIALVTFLLFDKHHDLLKKKCHLTGWMAHRVESIIVEQRHGNRNR